MLIVANHISWLDIFVLNAHAARRDSSRRPSCNAGRSSAGCAATSGTLFIERERRRDTHTVNRHTVEALARGDLVAVFPEGTTSDGTTLLKFHSSLLQPIVDARGVVQPIAIRYRTPAGEHSDAPAFVGDLTMVGSLLAPDRRALARRGAQRAAADPRGRSQSSRAVERRRGGYPNGFGVTGARDGT